MISRVCVATFNDFRFHSELEQELEGLLQVPLSQCLLMKNAKSKSNLHKISLAAKFTLRCFLIGHKHKFPLKMGLKKTLFFNFSY